MKKLLLIILIIPLIATTLSAQTSAKYLQLTKEGSTSLEKKEYEKSVILYREAFKQNSWKAFYQDRYNSACANAEAGHKDSAFFQLFKIAELYSYSDYNTLISEAHFLNLHSDKRWDEILTKVKQNIGKSESKLNKSLVILLDSVYKTDQSTRLNAVAVNNEFGQESKEAKEMWKKIKQKDSVNLFLVSNIIEKYGWPGKSVVGAIGNSAMFLVIQHADIKVQEKYLPVIREAVKNGNASAYDLAELEDIVALKQKRKQIYGSQLKAVDAKKYCVLPVENPETIDERRKKAGLNTMNEYLENWGMVWNITNYNKDLLVLEERKIQY
jgi:hypothetical protein